LHDKDYFWRPVIRDPSQFYMADLMEVTAVLAIILVHDV